MSNRSPVGRRGQDPRKAHQLKQKTNSNERSPERSSKSRKKPKRNPIASFFRWIFKTTIQVAIVVLVLFLGVVYYYSTTIPEFEEIVDGRRSGSVTFLDRNGEVFAWRGDQYDGNLRAENASEHLVSAVVATEDRNYYRHLGVSPKGIARALYVNYQENGNPFRGQGGSTITTQVAKLMCLGVPYDADDPEMGTMQEYEAECRRSSLDRKFKEIPYAMALELKFTKEEILSIYINRAYMGAGTYGFGAASNRYFNTPAQGLNPQQSAMLAGMLTAPSRYAPTNNLERSQDRAATVLRLMEEQSYLTPEEAAEARANPATLSSKAKSDLGIYFADWLMKDQPSFLTTETSEDIIYQTTFDPNMQRIAENAVDSVFSELVEPGSGAEAAVVVIEKTGAVRAMVGGRFEEDKIEQGFNRATDAKRQPGSSFKPFVYGAALGLGKKPYSTINDSPLQTKKGPWPKNYSGRYSGSNMTLIKALQNSTNTVAVKLSEQIGRDNVIEFAKALGVKSPMQPVPALALGSTEASLLELTSAYTGILNGTRPTTAFGWTQMGHKSDNAVIATNQPQISEPLLPEENAGWLIWMMKNVVDHGTGTRAKIANQQVAGKTGTTSDYKDAWFIGFTGEYVIGVWLGYDDNTPLKATTGGGLPAEIWKRAMTPIVAQYGGGQLPLIIPKAPPPPPPPKPENDVINDLIREVAPGSAPAQQAPQPTPAQPAPAQPAPVQPSAAPSNGGGNGDVIEQLLNDIIQ